MQQQVVYLVSSVERVVELGLPFAFTDGHAEMRVDIRYFDDPADLGQLDWRVLHASGWRNDEERRKRQSEFLVQGFLPLSGLLGFATRTSDVKQRVDRLFRDRQVSLRGRVRPDWYY
ncbi:hypothetical protein GCM10017781_45030 [Deinococcus metalli]|uniref:DarT domain-containing protein n=1 Tax=Deinococcus metalli TaxID=1141878 RepID=A0ABQ3JU46_9DEIO|nr:hypothetical protein GCM10017781_45030 [Deinococcus metalli]